MMDILESLKQEHSKKQTDRIVAFIGADKKRFAKLIGLFFKEQWEHSTPAFRSRAKQALREMEKANRPRLK